MCMYKQYAFFKQIGIPYIEPQSHLWQFKVTNVITHLIFTFRNVL